MLVEYIRNLVSIIRLAFSNRVFVKANLVIGEELYMKNILKRWGIILLGFCFIKIYDMADVIFIEDKFQFVFKVMCLLGALLSFFASIVTDEKIRLKSFKENKWIVGSAYISIAIMCVVVIILFLVGWKYFI